MIRNAVLHLDNEQPLVADLFELPSSSDVGFTCTNLRMPNGKRPLFADDSASVFFFPYLHIRFIEVPPASAIAAGVDLPSPVTVAAPVAQSGAAESLESAADLEIDEDFLRRIREV